MWCPGHFDIEGNERADKLAKSGSYLIPKKPNYKSLSYIGSLHKCEIGEEWLHRWTNSHTSLWSKFHIANHIPPCTKPSKRFLMLDHHMFSHTIQCWTGHTHIREYYQCFIPNKTQQCHCSETLQTWNHVLFNCKSHFQHRHLLGIGRACSTEVLLGSERGIKRLACFLKTSWAYKKWTMEITNNNQDIGARNERELSDWEVGIRRT